RSEAEAKEPRKSRSSAAHPEGFPSPDHSSGGTAAGSNLFFHCIQQKHCSFSGQSPDYCLCRPVPRLPPVLGTIAPHPDSGDRPPPDPPSDKALSFDSGLQSVPEYHFPGASDSSVVSKRQNPDPHITFLSVPSGLYHRQA